MGTKEAQRNRSRKDVEQGDGTFGRRIKFQASARGGFWGSLKVGALEIGGRACAAPRLRQSLAALGSGYGLNEKTACGYGRSAIPLSVAR